MICKSKTYNLYIYGVIKINNLNIKIMSKFKIGDTIHYMDNNKPTSGKVKGFAIIQGEIKVGYSEHKLNPTESKTIYAVGLTTYIQNENAFQNSNELKESLFNNLTEK